MPIRSIRVEDAAQCIQIYKPYVQSTPFTFETEVPSVPSLAKRIEEITEKFPWLVYEVDGVVVGYAYASAHRTRCAYEWSVESTVYVDGAHHGKAIGKQLYEALFALLKEQGVVNVLAGITQPNEKSVRLHESLGFTQIGLFKDIGFKLGSWWDVGWWQLQLQRPTTPQALQPPR
ncbi:MAG: N-acetyltransferase [Sandaracinaceae bacterium]|nr:N-acetyltransferase [Sandaracinaceae bacterium]